MQYSGFLLFGLLGERRFLLNESSKIGTTVGKKAHIPGQGRLLIWWALGDNPIAGLIATFSALAFISASLLNVGYTFAWNMAGILLFTPGDYVALSVPIFVLVGTIGLLALVFGFPAITLVGLLTILIYWRESFAVLTVLSTYVAVYFFFMFRLLRYVLRYARIITKRRSDAPARGDGVKALAKDGVKALAKAGAQLYALFLLYMIFGGIFLGSFFLLTAKTSAILQTAASITVLAFSAITFTWRLFVGLPKPMTLLAAASVGFLVSMPFTGYSLFIRQWTDAAQENSELGCPTINMSYTQGSPRPCMLRILEKGVLLADPTNGRLTFEDVEGRQIVWAAPKEPAPFWIDILLPQESGFEPIEWLRERAQDWQRKPKRTNEHSN